MVETSTTSNSNVNNNNLPPEDTRTTSRSSITFGPLGIARIFVNLFSTNDNRRDPPPSPLLSSSKTTPHSIRLITIGISHYCEKVRWGLDLVESNDSKDDNALYYYYTEDAHPPPFCSFATLGASNNEASATPMIVDSSSGTTTETYVNNSNVILSRYCSFLYPPEIRHDIEQMEVDLGRRLGPSIRCLAYHYLLQPEYESACVQLCCYGSSKVETLLFEKMLHRGIAKAMRRILQVNETTAIASRNEIIKVFTEISQRFEEQQQQPTADATYLMDTTTKDSSSSSSSSFGFTAADLTFAALSYPLIRPPEMTSFTIQDDSRLPPQLVSLGEQLRNTTAGQHVLKMYKQHRIPINYDYYPSVSEGCSHGRQRLVCIKSAERNVNPFSKLLTGSMAMMMGGIVGGAVVVVASNIWYRRQ